MNSYGVFLLKKILEAFINPPFMAYVLIGLGLILRLRKTSRGLLLAWCGLLIGLFLVTPVTVTWLAKQLETFPAVETARLKEAQGIVILGGGERSWAQEYGGAAPVGATLERLRYGARLARQTALPVLVSGGATPGHEPEAATMAESLQTDFGIAVRWKEDRSLDTADNARYSAEILKNAGITKIVLVTSASHMRRAVQEFKRAGLDVVPAPTAFFSDQPARKDLYEYLPGLSTAYIGSVVVHEWIGILIQRIRYGLAF
ncbi:MAG: YdcF family protein [Desulfocapsaceae bacterium]|nr:YdcF family protein [Desulfocapsaceae bacterium]